MECHQRLQEQKRHCLHFPITHLLRKPSPFFQHHCLCCDGRGCKPTVSLSSVETLLSLWRNSGKGNFEFLCVRKLLLYKSSMNTGLLRKMSLLSWDWRCWLLCSEWIIIPCSLLPSVWNMIIQPVPCMQMTSVTLIRLWAAVFKICALQWNDTEGQLFLSVIILPEYLFQRFITPNEWFLTLPLNSPTVHHK